MVITYIVEGETEETFVAAFKGKKILAGKVQVYNLWNNDIANKMRTIPKENTVVCILDTDITDNKSRLCSNLRKLKKQVKKLIVLVQNKNFEDELKRGLGKEKFKEFCKTSSVSEFKSKFIANRDIRSALVNHEFKIDNIWQENVEIKNTLGLKDDLDFSKNSIKCIRQK